MRAIINNLMYKARVLVATLLLVLAQVLAPVSAFMPTASAIVNECATDTAGANDEPGQKDLTKLCVDDTAGSTVHVTWNWDELDTSGANSLDACALFDTDNDGFINRSVCVTTKNDPAVLDTITIYTCGDTKIDRCTQPIGVVSGPYSTTCTVDQDNTDPFTAGAGYPNDTVADCTILLSEVGGSAAELVDVCSYPSKEPNSDPSDCVIIVDNSAKIEIVKQIVPETDSGLFNLRLDGVTKLANASDGDSTGEIVIISDNNGENFVVSETAGTNTALSAYSTTVVCRDQNGTGNIIASGSPTGTTSRQLTVNISAGTDVVCTFTNTRSTGNLKVVKDVINDNGGTKTSNDFTFTVNGGAPQTFVPTTGPDGERTLALPTGTYTVVEPEANTMGYSTSYSGCTSVQVVANQTATCTITNNDITGKMRVIKNVINDNGGNAVAGDFTLRVNGTARTQNQYFNADQGTYTVTETGPSGYTMTGISCVDDDTSDPVAHPVNLALNQSVTCTVTNNDNAPGLTVVKKVVNDNGGTGVVADFDLEINDSNLSFGSGVVNGSTTTYTSNPNVSANTNYTLSEIDFAGYSEGAWVCSDGSQPSGLEVTVNLDEGESVTCTIINNDIAPKLTVTKTVVNDNGGTLQVSDFPLYVDDLQVTSGAQNEFDAGLYVVSETTQPGYLATSWGGDCDANGNITLQIGGEYECTITNNDQTATVVVTKVVINDNGGNAVVSDFTLRVNDMTVTSGTPNNINGNSSYTISEINIPSGYVQDGPTVCKDTTGQTPVNVTNPFTAELGHSYSCTITNNDQAPGLTVVKEVINDNGGSAVISDFDIEMNDSNVTFGTGVVDGDKVTYSANPTVQANTNYTLSELDLPGYTEGVWSCTDGSQGSGLEVTVNLDEGENVTCTVTNNDISPELTVIKHVINDNGGDATADQFTMNVTGTNVSDNSFPGAESPGTTVTLDAGSYNVTEDELTGYAVTYSSDCGGSIAVGEKKTCTVTNDDVAPQLTLLKHVVNDNGGDAVASDWTLTANALLETDISGNGENGVVDAEAVANVEYTLQESGPAGYDVSADWSCDGGTFDTNANTLTLSEGDDVTCEITNNDIAPSLTIVKEARPDTDQVFSFSRNFGDNFTLTDGAQAVFTDLTAGDHEVTEQLPTGWKLSDVDCGQKTFTDITNGLRVNLGLDEDVTCTFFNDKLGRITGTKFEDVNINGVWDEGEPGLEGWTIELFKTCQVINGQNEVSLDFLEDVVLEECEETLVDDTETDANGSYSFDNLDAGHYKVCEVMQDGWMQTYPITNEGCHHVALTRPGQVAADTDFGNVELAHVNGFKYNDTNENAVFDKDEEKLSGWTIQLWRCVPLEETDVLTLQESEVNCEDQLEATTVTDSDGNYSFHNLKPGNYTVCEVQQEGWTQTAPATEDGCFEFTVDESGQTFTVNFGNKAKPGQVLGDDDLVNTGSSLAQAYLFGLGILGALSIVTFLSRRRNEI